MWLGSANATNAAFDGNVEFLVELEGKKGRCGIDACLGADDDTGLDTLLTEYEPRTEPIERDSVAEDLEALVDRVRRDLACAELALTAEPDGDDYTLMLEGHRLPPIPDDVHVEVWPATARRAVAGRPLLSDTSEPVVLGPLPTEMLTPFLAVAVRAEQEGRSAEAQFTLKVPLHGAPDDRREAVLRSILNNRSGLLRFLLLLLSQSRGGGLAAALATRLAALGEAGGGAADGPELPVLEALLQAADRDPAKLQSVRRLLDDMSQTDHGRELLGDDLPAICAAIYEATAEVVL